jgi:hypothetical protein
MVGEFWNWASIALWRDSIQHDDMKNRSTKTPPIKIGL